MSRRFYGFSSAADVRGHIEQIKTVADVDQLAFDIRASGSNLVQFQYGAEGIYAIDYAPSVDGERTKFYRHIFITKSSLKKFTPLVPDNCESFSVVRSSNDS